MTLWETRRRLYKRRYPPKGDMYDREEWPGKARKWRNQILELGNGCRYKKLGGCQGQLEAHHVDGNKWNNTLGNGVALCTKHHDLAQPLPYLICPDCEKYKLVNLEGLWLCETVTPISQDYDDEQFMVKIC